MPSSNAKPTAGSSSPCPQTAAPATWVVGLLDHAEASLRRPDDMVSGSTLHRHGAAEPRTQVGPGSNVRAGAVSSSHPYVTVAELAERPEISEQGSNASSNCCRCVASPAHRRSAIDVAIVDGEVTIRLAGTSSDRCA
jgi:hypothetical protein